MWFIIQKSKFCLYSLRPYISTLLLEVNGAYIYGRMEYLKTEGIHVINQIELDDLS